MEELSLGSWLYVGVIGGVILSILALYVAFAIRRRRGKDGNGDGGGDGEPRPLPQPLQNVQNPYYVSSSPRLVLDS